MFKVIIKNRIYLLTVKELLKLQSRKINLSFVIN
jgi:hypothetical protein